MDLEKFWLGNVNERGEIDQEGYDEDTKDGLLRTTKNENLVKSAVSEQDTAAARGDEDFEMPANTVAKAKDAQDYSKEEEVADDDEPSAYHVQKAQQLLEGKKAAAAKSKADDDYDEYDEEEEEEGDQPSAPAAQPASTPAPDGEEKTGAPAPSDEGEEGGDLPPAVPTTPMGRAASSDKVKDQFPFGGQGLRKRGLLLLSEMFVGPSNEPRIARTRKAATSLHAKVEVLSDEEDKFVDEAARRAAAAASLRLRDRMVSARAVMLPCPLNVDRGLRLARIVRCALAAAGARGKAHATWQAQQQAEELRSTGGWVLRCAWH